MTTEQDGNPQVHLALAKWCKSMSSWFEMRAAYHAAKSENPLAEIEIPLKPENPNE